MSFLFSSVLYFPHTYHNHGQGRKRGIDVIQKISITTKEIAMSFFQFQRSVLVSFAHWVSVQRVSVQRVYVQGGKCPRGKCQGVYVPGGICPRGKCPGGKCPAGKCLGRICPWVKCPGGYMSRWVMS